MVLSKSFKSYEDWLDAATSIDQADSWNKLDEIRNQAKRTVKHEGQEQLFKRYWGTSTETMADIEKTQPAEGTKAAEIWQEIKNQQYTERIQEERERVGLPELPEEEIEELVEDVTEETTPAQQEREYERVIRDVQQRERLLAKVTKLPSERKIYSRLDDENLALADKYNIEPDWTQQQIRNALEDTRIGKYGTPAEVRAKAAEIKAQLKKK